MNTARGHTLLLDGGAQSDVYVIHTHGSQGAAVSYVIDTIDTGPSADDVDSTHIYARDGPLNGIDPATDQPYPVDDIVLLRKVTTITCSGPAGTCAHENNADRPAFVAVLHGDVATVRPDPSGGTPGIVSVTTGAFPVERINYDTSINGRLVVYGLGGNDLFAVDDNSAITTLDGGAGDDRFQIGQIYGLQRQPANVAPPDAFETIATTRGYVSPGTSVALVAMGGTGNDQFTVYSNKAELRLEGNDGNDEFVVRAFARAQVNADGSIRTDAAGLAIPLTTGGFSTAEELAIRGGEGADQISYNINAPVSIDGGNGFDKVVVLGTEFPDHIVITDSGVFGAGVNVRYVTIEVLEVDGLEGDDQFFVQSTPFGVLTRVIGGLGSDTINVGSDVTADIFVRELEGSSGAVNHLVTSGDPAYNGLPAPGIDYNVASADSGVVIITETAGFTLVREGGLETPGGTVLVDRYFVRLAAPPTGTVYVTVSAACSPSEEQGPAPGTCLRTRPANSPVPAAGDTILLADGGVEPDFEDFYRLIDLAGVATWVPNRAVVLVFDASNWMIDQSVWVTAVDDLAVEGDRVVTIGHSVIAPHPDDAEFDHAAVRNVEVRVQDNDAPGLVVTPVDASGASDGQTIVIEGTVVTQMIDGYTLTLAKAPAAGKVVKVRITSLDGRLLVSSLDTDRFVGGVATFDEDDWDIPLLLVVRADNDFVVQDPFTAVLEHTVVVDVSDATIDATYVFATQLLGVDFYDDDSPNVVVVESGGSTVLVENGATDDYDIRLTQQPTAPVDVAVLTDGQADVVSIDGNPVTLQEIGAVRPATLFRGSLVLTPTTITRGTEFGNFNREGFAPDQLIQVSGFTATYRIASISADGTSMTVVQVTAGTTFGAATLSTATVSRMVNRGLFTGNVTYDAATNAVIRHDGSNWLADGFLEGQRIRIKTGANAGDYKIALIDGPDGAYGTVMHLTLERLISAALGEVTTVTQLAAVVTFTPADHYVALEHRARGRPAVRHPVLPPGRQAVPGPAAPPHPPPWPARRRGRRHRRRPLAAAGRHAAVGVQRSAVRHPAAAAGEPADRHAQRVRRLQPGAQGRHAHVHRPVRSRHGRPAAALLGWHVRRARDGAGWHQLRRRARRSRHRGDLDRRLDDDDRGAQHPARQGQRPPDGLLDAGPRHRPVDRRRRQPRRPHHRPRRRQLPRCR